MVDGGSAGEGSTQAGGIVEVARGEFHAEPPEKARVARGPYESADTLAAATEKLGDVTTDQAGGAPVMTLSGCTGMEEPLRG